MKDAKTFEAIYLKYYPQLFVYGKTIFANEQMIEDTIQELFLVLWQKNRNLIFTSSLEHYLFISFRNNLLRKVKANPLSNHNLPPLATSEGESDGKLEKEEQLKLLLQKLPTRQREVLFLRYYKDQSYHEIAATLDISYQVARNFAYRAIKALKLKMKKLQFTEMALLLLCHTTYLCAS